MTIAQMQKYQQMLAGYQPLPQAVPPPGYPPGGTLAQQIQGLTAAQAQAIMQQMRLAVAPPAPLVEEAWDGQTIYRGWRAFTTDRRRLWSVTQAMEWTSDTLNARCRHGHDHAVPDADCTCGIYVYNNRNEAMTQIIREGMEWVIGECVVWGKVIEAEHGYRAEHCRIEGLWTMGGDDQMNTKLSEAYGVPCRNLWDALGR